MAGQRKFTTEDFVTERIKYFWECKRTYEATKRAFEDDKYDFNNEMDKYFEAVADDDGKFTVKLEGLFKGVDKLVCQKITQVKVDFNIKKLSKVIDKEQRKKVIRKNYQVNNWPGLLQLLKDSGVEWKEFLKYVDVTEYVDEKKLEQLAELGEISVEDIKPCTKTSIRTQYYKLTEK